MGSIWLIRVMLPKHENAISATRKKITNPVTVRAAAPPIRPKNPTMHLPIKESRVVKKLDSSRTAMPVYGGGVVDDSTDWPIVSTVTG